MSLTVDEIRMKLVELGMSEKEVAELKGKANLLNKLEELEKDSAPFEFEEPEAINEDNNVEKVPYPNDVEWKNYIMTQFDPVEEIFNGCPTVDGLRRVTEKVFGPILESNAKVIQSPNKSNDYHAVVEHEIVILRKNFLEDGEVPYRQIVTEVADVRTDEQENTFTRYSSAYASTRAEGRALRKILRLRKIVAAEEVDSNNGFDNVANDGLKITHSLCTTVNLLCNRADINPWELVVNNCPVKVEKPKDIPFNFIKEIIPYLNKVIRGEEEAPSYCRGYEPMTLD